jgi:hypothetical protein
VLLDRMTRRDHSLEMNSDSYRLKQSESRRRHTTQPAEETVDPETGEITVLCSTQLPRQHSKAPDRGACYVH